MTLQTMTREQIRAVLDAGPYQRPSSTTATCHPWRTHTAHGLCRECYGRWYRKQAHRA